MSKDYNSSEGISEPYSTEGRHDAEVPFWSTCRLEACTVGLLMELGWRRDPDGLSAALRIPGISLNEDSNRRIGLYRRLITRWTRHGSPIAVKVRL